MSTPRRAQPRDPPGEHHAQPALRGAAATITGVAAITGVSAVVTELPPASGAWREGDDPGRRQWVQLAAPLRLEAGGELPGVRHRLRDLGELNAAASNAVLVMHALTGDSHVAGPAGRRPRHPGVVGRGGRARPRARPRPLVRGRPERRRRMPGQHRSLLASPPTGARGAAASRWSPRATPSPPRRCSPTRSASTAGRVWSAVRWAACARSSGRPPSPTACRGCSCWPARPRRRRTRSAGRRRSSPRSAATRAGAAATTIWRPRARARTSGSASPGGWRT